MKKPTIQYTKSGNMNIAYQVFGSGPVDLVYIPGWVSNIDWMWACPELVYFFEELGKIARVILFDKRGTGLSDRVVDLSTLEERMEDIKSVMNAVDSQKAILFGHSEGGSVSALFSATYPNRVQALISFGIFAKRKYADDYPWAPTDAEREKLYRMIENSWGSGDMRLETLAPSKANDEQFMSWMASYFRSGASPQAALKLTKMNTEVNIMGILKFINVPTLLMQRSRDIDVKIEEGKFIAKHIKGAKFVEFKGADHLFWAGNIQEVLDQMTCFIKELKPDTTIKKGLFATLMGLFNKPYGKDELHFNSIKQIIHTYEGRIVGHQGLDFVAAFEVPGKAVQCSLAIQEAIKYTNERPAFGVCIKECMELDKLIQNNEEEGIVKAMRSKLIPNEILVTPTVKHLLSGAQLNFIPKTLAFDDHTLVAHKLYSVSNMASASVPLNRFEKVPVATYNNFLEDVLKIINTHLEDDFFNVEILSEKMGLSERQLQRKIKETTGKSPKQLITSIRLNKAKAALMSNIYTVAEIAFKFGFTCPSYFSKCFKKEFGSQPKALLQKA